MADHLHRGWEEAVVAHHLARHLDGPEAPGDRGAGGTGPFLGALGAEDPQRGDGSWPGPVAGVLVPDEGDVVRQVLHHVDAATVHVDGAGMDGRVGIRTRDGAQHGSGQALDHLHLTPAGAAEVRERRRRDGEVDVPVPAGRPGTEEAAFHEDAEQRVVGQAEEGQVRGGEGQLRGGGAQVGGEHVRVGGVEGGGLDG